jgi:hypothetical protein
MSSTVKQIGATSTRFSTHSFPILVSRGRHVLAITQGPPYRASPRTPVTRKINLYNFAVLTNVRVQGCGHGGVGRLARGQNNSSLQREIHDLLRAEWAVGRPQDSESRTIVSDPRHRAWLLSTRSLAPILPSIWVARASTRSAQGLVATVQRGPCSIAHRAARDVKEKQHDRGRVWHHAAGPRAVRPT